MTNTKKKAFKLPHQLVILFGIAVLATLATYIVPAGVYDQIEGEGRKAIDAASFHYIDQTPVSPWTALLALPGAVCKERRHHRDDYDHPRCDWDYQRDQVL